MQIFSIYHKVCVFYQLRRDIEIIELQKTTRDYKTSFLSLFSFRKVLGWFTLLFKCNEIVDYNIYKSLCKKVDINVIIRFIVAVTYIRFHCYIIKNLLLQLLARTISSKNVHDLEQPWVRLQNCYFICFVDCISLRGVRWSFSSATFYNCFLTPVKMFFKSAVLQVFELSKHFCYLLFGQKSQLVIKEKVSLFNRNLIWGFRFEGVLEIVCSF